MYLRSGFVVVCTISFSLCCGPSAMARILTVMPESQVDAYQKVFPAVGEVELNDILYSEDTVWYDRSSIVPGYQDSYGDETTFPVGFRPNSIEKGLINLAVPGGWEQIFSSSGQFHFPFHSGGLDSSPSTQVIDFWSAPKSGGRVLPVAWTKWEPTTWTHRYEWMFPVGTVFGEILFLIEGTEKYVFEIRTRTRYLGGWKNDIHRPFKTAIELAQALEFKRRSKPEWANSTEIEALVQHLRKPDNLVKMSMKGTHFAGAFAQLDGVVDALPALSKTDILKELLRSTVFDSVKGTVWKDDGVNKAFAPSSQAGFHIVPQKYEGALLEVSETSCNRCHMDAGRPFKDFYSNITPYGELWGEDDVFSWHPFETAQFVDTATGKVKNFNNDNRVFRKDFVNAGLVEKYDAKKHPAAFYKRLDRKWKNYKH